MEGLFEWTDFDGFFVLFEKFSRALEKKENYKQFNIIHDRNMHG